MDTPDDSKEMTIHTAAGLQCFVDVLAHLCAKLHSVSFQQRPVGYHGQLHTRHTR